MDAASHSLDAPSQRPPPTYAQVLSTSPNDGGESLGVTRRRQIIRSQQHSDNDNDDFDARLDDDTLDVDEIFMFEESLRRGNAAQARRAGRLAQPRRSLEATPDELSVYTSSAWDTAANAPLRHDSSLNTVIHPPSEAMFARSESPDELDMLSGEYNVLDRARSRSILSGTSARRSNSIYSPARGGNDAEDSLGGTGRSTGPGAQQLRSYESSLNRSRPRRVEITTRERASADIASSLNAMTAGEIDDEEDDLAWLPTLPNRNRAGPSATQDGGKPVLLLYCGGSTSASTYTLPADFYYVDSSSEHAEPAELACLPPFLRHRIAKMQEEDRLKKASGNADHQTGGGCGALVCARAATTLDPKYLESDCPPSSQVADWLDIKENTGHQSHNMGGWRLWQNCGCMRANIGCIACGNTIGATTIRPCTRCARRYLGQPKYTFYADSVTTRPRYSLRQPPRMLEAGATATTSKDSMLHWTNANRGPALPSTPHKHRLPSRDEDIRAGLAGDPVLWAESSRELLRTANTASGEDEVKRVWTDWLDEPDRGPSTSNPTVANRSTDRPWRHRTDWSIGSAGSSRSIFFGDSGLSNPSRRQGGHDPASTIPLLEQAEQELEEAERTFMASAAPSIAAEHAAITGNSEERTVEQIRSSAPAIVQRARALRRDLRHFVNRIPGQPAEPNAASTTARTSGNSGQRRRRSLSPSEFDEMSERVMRDVRRRRVDRQNESEHRPSFQVSPEDLVGR